MTCLSPNHKNCHPVTSCFKCDVYVCGLVLVKNELFVVRNCWTCLNGSCNWVTDQVKVTRDLDVVNVSLEFFRGLLTLFIEMKIWLILCEPCKLWICSGIVSERLVAICRYFFHNFVFYTTFAILVAMQFFRCDFDVGFLVVEIRGTSFRQVVYCDFLQTYEIRFRFWFIEPICMGIKNSNCFVQTSILSRTHFCLSKAVMFVIKISLIVASFPSPNF